MNDTRASSGFPAAQQALFDALGLDVRSALVTLDGVPGRIHVFESGPTDSSIPLVFVHGSATFGAFLAPLMAELENVRIVAFDRPGYGLSDAFEYSQDNLTSTNDAVLTGLLDHLGVEQVDLVGHSLGGRASLQFARHHPERVRGLILLGAIPTFPGTHPPLALRLMMAPMIGKLLRKLERSGEKGVMDLARIFHEAEAVRNSPEMIHAVAAHNADPISHAAGQSEFEALFSARDWHPSVRLRRGDLEQVRRPTTFVWGENDPLATPSEIRDVVESLPEGSLVTIEAGHFPHISRPSGCARVVEEARV